MTSISVTIDIISATLMEDDPPVTRTDKARSICFALALSVGMGLLVAVLILVLVQAITWVKP